MKVYFAIGFFLFFYACSQTGFKSSSSPKGKAPSQTADQTPDPVNPETPTEPGVTDPGPTDPGVTDPGPVVVTEPVVTPITPTGPTTVVLPETEVKPSFWEKWFGFTVYGDEAFQSICDEGSFIAGVSYDGENGKIHCEPYPVVEVSKMPTGSCPEGKYLSGISGVGDLVCRDLPLSPLDVSWKTVLSECSIANVTQRTSPYPIKNSAGVEYLAGQIFLVAQCPVGKVAVGNFPIPVEGSGSASNVDALLCCKVSVQPMAL